MIFGLGGLLVYFNGCFFNGLVWYEVIVGNLVLLLFLGGIVGDLSNGINFVYGGVCISVFDIVFGVLLFGLLE